jgi:hypothetical protein
MLTPLYIAVRTIVIYICLVVVISVLDLLINIEGPGQFIDFSHIITQIILGLIAFYIAISWDASKD